MKQLVSILLSALMLISSTGLAYAQHFCGDYEMLTEITLGEKHLSCGMAVEDSACGDEHSEDHDCCDNEYTKVTTDNHFAKASFNIGFDQTFVVAFVATYILDIPLSDVTETDRYSEYNPPPLIKDIPVLFETFLI